MLVDTNRIVAVGTPIMRLRGTSTEVPVPRDEASPPAVAASEIVGPTVAVPTVAAPTAAHAAVPAVLPGAITPGSRVLASPLARRMAQERQIDLAAVTGSGPDGSVRARDLGTAVTRPTDLEATATTASSSHDRGPWSC